MAYERRARRPSQRSAGRADGGPAGAGIARGHRRAADRAPRARSGRLHLARGRAPGAAGGAVLGARRSRPSSSAPSTMCSATGACPSGRHRSTSLRRGHATALPHAGIPATAPGPPEQEAEPTAVPAAWSDVELLRAQGLCQLHGSGDGGRAGADRAPGPARADAAFAPHAALAPPRARRRTCGGWSAARCARPESRSTGCGARPRAGRARWCWCSTCRAR